MVRGGTNFRKKAHDRHTKRKAPPGKKRLLLLLKTWWLRRVVDECIIDESGTMDDVEEGPSKQTISESKVEETTLPDVAEEFIAPTGHRRKWVGSKWEDPLMSGWVICRCLLPLTTKH